MVAMIAVDLREHGAVSRWRQDGKLSRKAGVHSLGRQIVASKALGARHLLYGQTLVWELHRPIAGSDEVV